MTATGIPDLRKIWKLVDTEEGTLNFLFEVSVLSQNNIFSRCGTKMGLNRKLAPCTNTDCRVSVSCLKGTFFAKSRLKISDTMLLGYLWLTGASYTTALALTAHGTKTIVEYYRYFHELVAD